MDVEIITLESIEITHPHLWLAPPNRNSRVVFFLAQTFHFWDLPSSFPLCLEKTSTGFCRSMKSMLTSCSDICKTLISTLGTASQQSSTIMRSGITGKPDSHNIPRLHCRNPAGNRSARRRSPASLNGYDVTNLTLQAKGQTVFRERLLKAPFPWDFFGDKSSFFKTAVTTTSSSGVLAGNLVASA